ncbi:MAG: tRNA lysidine(34) synthetase TilS [Gammaproteobacteria bacterium]|nr:tRNA lysidine(34) synthetase TilS [Gammaproteobacteria bacterium]
MVFTASALISHLKSLQGINKFLIAYSGGLDSTVLLHAIASIRAELNIPIEAAHVHHGLQTEADRWVNHCKQFCDQLNISCHILRVDARPKRGESPEAAARGARYQSLRPLVAGGTCLFTAHHQDDQAETLLLQLLRGAGPNGLAAMPLSTGFSRGRHARPLLSYSRSELIQYAGDKQLDWIDDPSNFDTNYDRNFLRHQVIPLLRQRWPAMSCTLSRVADIQAESAELTGILAETDRQGAVGSRSDTLSVCVLNRLSKPRRNNVLRHWITERALPMPNSRQLAQVSKDMLHARQDSTPYLRWPGGELRRYRDDLHAILPLEPHDSTQSYHWTLNRELPIPHLGLTLTAEALKAQGLELPTSLNDITVRFRQGGECCKLKGRKNHHALKKLFQGAGILPWERNRIPLIYADGRLVVVWGYWVCC